MNMPRLRIERADEGFSDRNRTYKIFVIFVNGEQRDEVAKGETKTLKVDPGETEVYVNIDWSRSRKKAFDTRPDTETRFACGPKGSWTWLWRAMFSRNDYLWLEQEEPTAQA